MASLAPSIGPAQRLAAAVRNLRDAVLRAPPGSETRLFVNWALVWLVLLNAPFIPMWFVGGPSRFAPIVVLTAVGLVARGFPAWQRQLLFAAALTFGVLRQIAGIFNLEMTSLMYSVRFLAELSPGNSLEYIAGGAILALTMLLGVLLAHRPMHFSGSRQMACAAAGIAVVLGGDAIANYDLRGHYKQEPPSDARFESGAQNSGWATAANGKRHQLLVVVESLGLPSRDPELRRRLFASFLTPAVRQRYDVTIGTTLYYNSTTAGEVRELCGRWGDYYDLVERRDERCLPAQLRARGYRTIGWHSFEGNFFQRHAWYPNIGFEERKFGPDLVRDGAEICGGVFPGACDRDIPRMIGARLASAGQPTFLYWLTVNSHLPVPPGENLEDDRCAAISPRLAREMPMVCRQLAIWQSIDRALAQMATAEDFPDTDILIVGDHMPPYFDRTMRTQFDPRHVPWIRLSPRVNLAHGDADATRG